MVVVNDKPIGSDIVGQLWTKPQYFAGRSSAAGKTAIIRLRPAATNLGPTSKKLIDATRGAMLKKANPDTTLPIPMDLVTSSASGIDLDISPEAAYYQVPRIAKARKIRADAVTAIVAKAVHPRELGFSESRT